MQGIYAIRNRVNGKKYIGSSQNAKRRWGEHRRALKAGKHWNRHLQFAWGKYGSDFFDFEVVELVQNVGELLGREQYWIDQYYDSGMLYNIASDASAPRRGKEPWNKGKVGIYSQETIESIRRSVLEYYETHDGPTKGKTFSGELRRKLSEAHMGQKAWNKGIPCSEEAKAKLRAAKKGKKLSKEHAEKIRQALLGRTSPMLGRHHTELTKRQISDTLSKPYPEFYNEITGEYIPAGNNLMRLCEAKELKIRVMCNLRNGTTRRSHNGWVLAIEVENES